MPLALPRRRALPDATLKSNKAEACSRFVKGKKKRNKKREDRRKGPAGKERVKVLPRSAPGQRGRKKREKRGKDEKRTRAKKKKNEKGRKRDQKREGRLDGVETAKPKRRIGET